jgi:hypothetical protein
MSDDETEDVTPHPNLITEEAAASLDPVTERLILYFSTLPERWRPPLTR